jgi:hypothetical protein
MRSKMDARKTVEHGCLGTHTSGIPGRPLLDRFTLALHLDSTLTRS